jgi:polyisoprenoid-binding protein YceI
MRLLVAAFLLSSAPTTDVPITFGATSGTVRYTLVHKFHELEGVSKGALAKARVMPDGTLQVMVRVPVESFDSGNANRDAHMLEVLDAARFPNVELKATGRGFSLPQAFPSTLTVRLAGTLTFHGVGQQRDLAVQLTFTDASSVNVDGSLSVSLESFGIERPALLFVKVDDRVDVRWQLSMRRE